MQMTHRQTKIIGSTLGYISSVQRCFFVVRGGSGYIKVRFWAYDCRKRVYNTCKNSVISGDSDGVISNQVVGWVDNQYIYNMNTVTKDELTALQSSDTPYQLIDIREAEELESTPLLPEAIHMPMGKVFTEVAAQNLAKDKKIVVYCKTGGRSAIVARELSAMGFDVVSIQGGLDEYQSAVD